MYLTLLRALSRQISLIWRVLKYLFIIIIIIIVVVVVVVVTYVSALVDGVVGQLELLKRDDSAACQLITAER